MLRRKRTEEEDKLLKLLQGIKQPQDGFTTWCEQMLHALNTSANNSSSALDGRPPPTRTRTPSPLPQISLSPTTPFRSPVRVRVCVQWPPSWPT